MIWDDGRAALNSTIEALCQLDDDPLLWDYSPWVLTKAPDEAIEVSPAVAWEDGDDDVELSGSVRGVTRRCVGRTPPFSVAHRHFLDVFTFTCRFLRPACARPHSITTRCSTFWASSRPAISCSNSTWST